MRSQRTATGELPQIATTREKPVQQRSSTDKSVKKRKKEKTEN